MKNLFKILTLVVSFGNINILNAQWVQTNGPCNAKIRSIGGNDRYLYCATYGSVNITAKDKDSWQRITANLGSYDFTALVVNGNDIYTGTDKGGVYYSSDNGTNWLDIHFGLPSTSISSIFMYGTSLFVGTPYDVYRSTDNGLNWTDISQLHGYSVNYSFAVMDTNLFCCFNGNVYRSQDNGYNWAKMSQLNYTINTLIVKDSLLFAGTINGIYYSKDVGKTWGFANSGIINNNIQTFTLSDSNLYAGTAEGVFVSANNGTNWELISNGLGNASISSFYIYSDSNNVINILAGTPVTGIYKSTDNGNNWSDFNSGMPPSEVRSLVVVPNSTGGNNLLAGAYGIGIFLSTNSGNNWSQVTTDQNGMYIFSFAVKDTTLFAGDFNKGMLISTDKGITWSTIDSGLSDPSIHCIVVKDSNVFVGTHNGGGVYRTSNNGIYWSRVSYGLPNKPIYSLVAKDSILFAGTVNGGIYHTTNNGITWNISNTNINASIYSLTLSGNNIIAGTEFGTTLVSVDDGLSWNQHQVSGIQIHSLFNYRNSLIIGTNGIYSSNDDGTTVLDANLGFSKTDVFSFTADKIYLYAAASNGVWRRPLSELITGVEEKPNNVPAKYSLFQNFPNPFNPSTNILYSISKAGFVSLKVYDVLGREIKTLINEEKSPGNFTIQFDGSKLPSGIYFYRMQAGNFTETKKLILLK